MRPDKWFLSQRKILRAGGERVGWGDVEFKDGSSQGRLLQYLQRGSNVQRRSRGSELCTRTSLPTRSLVLSGKQIIGKAMQDTCFLPE